MTGRKVNEIVVGRRFSKMSFVENEDGSDVIHVPYGMLFKRDMVSFEEKATKFLEGGNFDPKRHTENAFLELRFAWFNFLSDEPIREDDAQTALAVQILQAIYKYRAAEKSTPVNIDLMVDSAYQFGHLWRLFDVYEQQAEQAKAASKQKRLNGADPKNKALEMLLSHHKARSRSLKEALSILESKGEIEPDEADFWFKEKRYTRAATAKIWAKCNKF